MIYADSYYFLTSLTFYGGVNEIGGNKILLEDKDTRVFLDFGKGFSRRAKFFEEYINPRVANGIEDFLTMRLLPDIKGLYRDDLMRMAEREILELDVDAVLLSHAHSDHAVVTSGRPRHYYHKDCAIKHHIII
jgi:ribonuclease J